MGEVSNATANRESLVCSWRGSWLQSGAYHQIYEDMVTETHRSLLPAERLGM